MHALILEKNWEMLWNLLKLKPLIMIAFILQEDMELFLISIKINNFMILLDKSMTKEELSQVFAMVLLD